METETQPAVVNVRESVEDEETTSAPGSQEEVEEEQQAFVTRRRAGGDEAEQRLRGLMEQAFQNVLTMRLAEVPVFVSLRQVNYSIKTPTGSSNKRGLANIWKKLKSSSTTPEQTPPPKRRLLTNISVEAAPGELIALMVFFHISSYSRIELYSN